MYLSSTFPFSILDPSLVGYPFHWKYLGHLANKTLVRSWIFLKKTSFIRTVDKAITANNNWRVKN